MHGPALAVVAGDGHGRALAAPLVGEVRRAVRADLDVAVQAAALGQVVRRDAGAEGRPAVVRGRAEGGHDVLAAVVDGVLVVGGRQVDEAVSREGPTADALVVHPAGDAAAGARGPGLAVVVGVAGEGVHAGQLGLEGPPRAAVGEQDRVEALGAALGTAAGGVGGDVLPGRLAVRPPDPVGREVGLVHRGVGPEAVADRRLTGVVGVGERPRCLEVPEGGRLVVAGLGVGRPVHEPGGGPVALTDRGEGHHPHRVVPRLGSREDQLGVAARRRGGHRLALAVEHVDVEVGRGVLHPLGC